MTAHVLDFTVDDGSGITVRPLDARAAVALAEAQSRNEFTRRISHLDEFVAVLAGTYDEFRAEASR